MKIFVDAHIFDHSYQGTHTYIKGLYNALVENQNVEIYLGAQNIENLKKHFPDPRFNFIKIDTHNKWKRLAITLPEIIKQGKYDYSHFQYITPFLKSSKYITTTHDILFLDFPKYFPFSYRLIKGFLFKFSAKNSDLTLTVSNYSKTALVKHFKLNPDKVIVTPNAVLSENKEETTLSNSHTHAFPEKYVLFVSRFEPRKNQVGLLEAFISLNLFEKGYSLVIIGGKKEKIEQTYYSHFLKNIPAKFLQQVICIENISGHLLNLYYKNADCFVYPSFAEGFGIPPLEAAIAGTKVLCSNTTSMSDFDFFKYQFDPNNKLEFTNKLTAILNDSNYPFEEIKTKIISKYNWSKIASDFYMALSKNNN